jgi:hypothetical protein
MMEYIPCYYVYGNVNHGSWQWLMQMLLGSGRMVSRKNYMKQGCGGRREAFHEKELNYISKL